MKNLKRSLLLLLGAFLLYIALLTVVLLVLRYPTKVAETNHYVVRHKSGGIDLGRYCLYEKGVLWDHYLMDLASDELIYDLKDFQVDEEQSTVSFCLSLNKTWQEEWNRSDSCEVVTVLPLP